MSQLMQLKDVAESTRLGPLSGEVSAGEILHLVGPNGAGKSTLLARMAGLTSGEGSISFPVASGSVFALLPLYYKFIPTLIRSVNYCCLMSR